MFWASCGETPVSVGQPSDRADGAAGRAGDVVAGVLFTVGALVAGTEVAFLAGIFPGAGAFAGGEPTFVFGAKSYAAGALQALARSTIAWVTAFRLALA